MMVDTIDRGAAGQLPPGNTWQMVNSNDSQRTVLSSRYPYDQLKADLRKECAPYITNAGFFPLFDRLCEEFQVTKGNRIDPETAQQIRGRLDEELDADGMIAKAGPNRVSADQEEVIARIRENVPEELRDAPIWLLYAAETNGEKKPRKVPYYANGSRRTGKLDSPEDRSKLVTFEEAAEALLWSSGMKGLGIALGYCEQLGDCVQGVDFDDVPSAPMLVMLEELLPGYVETSPSGNGTHSLGVGGEFRTLGSNGTGVEAYAGGRFFTVTGEKKRFSGDPEDISEFVHTILAPLHDGVPPQAPNAPGTDGVVAGDFESGILPLTDGQFVDLRSALAAIPSDDRDLWIRYALILKPHGDRGRALWEEWSQKSEKYDPADAADKWRSARPDGRITVNTIFAEAQAKGWVNPRKTGGQETAQLPTEPLPEDWREKFMVTDEQVAAMVNPDWIYENLIISGHLVALIGSSGAGKSRIMRHVASEIVSRGYRVTYVNADISGGDAKEWRSYAKQAGFDLLLPDIAGGSMGQVVDTVDKLSRQSGDLSEEVFIFDTLKKMTCVINKNEAKRLYEVLRRLTARGATVVVQGHTNKYKGDDGKPMYEGTGDLRADVDELIYLLPEKQPDGSLVVSTDPDKVRGDLKPITFKIHPDKTTVTQMEAYVDVATGQKMRAQLEEDQEAVEIITGVIGQGAPTQAEIIEQCGRRKLSRRKVRSVLERYSGTSSFPKYWEVDRLAENNAYRYRLLPNFSGEMQ